MIGWITKRPWLAVIAAFVVLIAAWTALILIAVKNKPTEIPLRGDGGPVAGEEVPGDG